MMEVADVSIPKLSLPLLDKTGKPIKDKITKQDAVRDCPLVRCYPFKQGSRWAVGLLSLKMPGRHADQDLGDGSTKCSIKLPFSKATKISLVTLEGDPRDTNDEELKIKQRRVEVPASALKDGVLTVDKSSGSKMDALPCGSMYVYIFEGAE